MIRKEHSPFIENIPAYALGALDAEDAAVLESHLQTCAACRDELAVYRAVSRNLLIALPPQSPSAALRQRLQNQLPGARRNTSSRLNWPFAQIAIGVAFVLLLALNIFSIYKIQTLQTQQLQFTRQLQNSQSMLAMLSYPDTRSISINADNGVTGSLLLNKEHNAMVLVLWNLPMINSKQTYQVWLIDSQEGRHSVGWFRPETGQPFTSETIFAKQDLSNFVGIGVTLEPAGGSSAPTGPRLFRLDF